MLSIYLIFCQFQPGVAYKGVAYIKKRVPHASKCDQGGSFLGGNCLGEVYRSANCWGLFSRGEFSGRQAPSGEFSEGLFVRGQFSKWQLTETASEKKLFLIVTFLILLSVEQNKHCTKS